jgi:hypothetical protein
VLLARARLLPRTRVRAAKSFFFKDSNDLICAAQVKITSRLRAIAVKMIYACAPKQIEEVEWLVAQKIQTLFIDDLDGSPAEGTVRFGLDGTDYEIDLNAEHAQELRSTLVRYVEAARRGPGTRRPAPRRARKSGSDGLNSTEVRDWARGQGIEVKDRGRIPAELVVKFRAATGQ